jgi:predicted TIM-barrel fold metal-dependent hydrolase
LNLRTVIDAELAPLGDMQLFDAHSHTGTDVDGTSRTCEEHVEALEAIGGGRSVVFPLAVEGGYEDENRRVIDECARHSEHLVPFARLDPRTISPRAAADALAAGAQGFKLHPRAEHFRLDDPGVETLTAVAAKARVPVLIHAGVGVGSFGRTVTDLAARHRGCPIILAHAAVSDLAWLWRVAPEHQNLFFDTSWWNAADLLALFALVPPGQILFGSDEPYMDLEAVLAITLRCAHFAGLSPEAIESVLGGQLDRLLAGKAPEDAGPAPGPPSAAPSPTESRLATLIAAAGGCALGGGDASRLLELARAGIGKEGSALSDGSEPLMAALIEESAAGSAESPWALAMALAILATPGVESAVPVA